MPTLGGLGLGSFGGEVAARELRNRERPSHEAERLDDRCGRPTCPLRFSGAAKDSA